MADSQEHPHAFYHVFVRFLSQVFQLEGNFPYNEEFRTSPM
ncbi:hypothetical protein JCM19233_1960 [Vibrio astriarenae]|nr:hypothetical protein JCM19233_1960 [Vibrio sp. C7]